MLTFDVAHVRLRNVALVLVPVRASFARRSHAERLRIAATLQRYANRARLAGAAVPVWRGDDGGLRFFARPSLHQAAATLSWDVVAAAVYYRLTIAAEGPVGRRAAAA